MALKRFARASESNVALEVDGDTYEIADVLRSPSIRSLSNVVVSSMPIAIEAPCGNKGG